MRKIESIETEKFTIAEVPASELVAPSGRVTPDGRPITNIDAITEMFAAENTRVWVSPNGVLSREAQQHNSELTRDSSRSVTEKAGKYIVAIRGEKPVIRE